ncbi:MAG: Na+/H+ antiporter subunit E [Alphaproteobacteria bacterium]|nr:Na+/H+ antiporter subunit E [Alphaproteobacteria bacterium]
MARALSLGIVLFATWMLLSGEFSIQHGLVLGLGIGSVILVVLIAVRMDVVDHEGHPVHLTRRFIGYWIWLLVEIVKASIDVTKRIWSPSLPISPTMYILKVSQPGELGQVIYAISITLTPGTVTVRLDGGDILVHAIAREAGEDLAGGEMDRRVTRLEASGITVTESVK